MGVILFEVSMVIANAFLVFNFEFLIPNYPAK